MSSARQPGRGQVLRRARIRAEQVRSVYLHSPTTTVGSLAAGFALVLIMWGHVSHTMLVVWLIALCLHQTLRVYHYRRYTRASPDEQQHEGWGRLYIAAAATAGVIWGAAGVLMYVPDSLAHQAMLVLILWGFATATMTSLSVFAPAFYVLIPLTLLPIIVRMLFDPGPARVYLAIPGIIMFFVVLSFGRTIHRIASEAIEKRFENLDLIDELRAKKALAEQARQEAESANRSKTQFFAAASHDLRQPLHALGLFAAALYDQVKEAEVLKLVKSINASVAALEGLFNELLDIAKIDSGVIKPVLANFRLRGMFDRLRSQFTAEADAKRLRLSVEGDDCVVMSDPILLERILSNLLSNAIRYTAQGEVRLLAAAEGDAVRIEVRDTGVGVRPEHQQRIFEEFFQLGNPARTSAKGLGLGLSIVKRLCGLLAYEMRLASEYGKGSSFSFHVPGGTLPAAAPAVRAAAAPKADLAGRLVVVIDDEPAIVEGMKVLLSRWGVEVIGSLTGEDVIAAVHAKERMPDLIIADYRLGENLNGTQVIEQLRSELDPEIPAILITGSSAPERVSEADSRRYKFLLKPVQPEMLRASLDALLRPAPA